MRYGQSDTGQNIKQRNMDRDVQKNVSRESPFVFPADHVAVSFMPNGTCYPTPAALIYGTRSYPPSVLIADYAGPSTLSSKASRASRRGSMG
jgi:hypothetical protein